jgi:uncharacterized iron-regulated protein
MQPSFQLLQTSEVLVLKLFANNAASAQGCAARSTGWPTLRGFAAVYVALLCLGCATRMSPNTALRFERPVVLLGEVHDHAQQHALRLAAFEAHLKTGARPALLLEQLDADRQVDIERLRAAGADADALIASVGGKGWHWPFYRPFIEHALRHGLPIVAVNVPREAARAVMRDGLAAHGFDAAVPEPMLAAQAQAIEASHCGMVDTVQARRMALAQVARDQAMARALRDHASRGAVLLAGNGHVRADIGMPRWLDPALRVNAQVIGMVEEGDTTAAFDRRIVTPQHPRPDPCAGFRRNKSIANEN